MAARPGPHSLRWRGRHGTPQAARAALQSFPFICSSKVPPFSDQSSKQMDGLLYLWIVNFTPSRPFIQ